MSFTLLLAAAPKSTVSGSSSTHGQRKKISRETIADQSKQILSCFGHRVTEEHGTNCYALERSGMLKWNMIKSSRC